MVSQHVAICTRIQKSASDEIVWRAQFSKMNRLTVGYLAGWAAPHGGPLDAALDSAQAAAAIRYI